MNLLHKFWTEFWLNGNEEPSDDDARGVQQLVDEMLKAVVVPFLFPQWLLTEANYKTSMRYASYCYDAYYSPEEPTVSEHDNLLPQEFREYIATAVADVMGVVL